MKSTKIINIILFGMIIILVINLIYPLSELTGNLVYNMDTSQSKCSFYNSGELNEIQIEYCCYEIQKQLICKEMDKNNELKCYTSIESEKYYLINYKTFNYCKKEGYDVKIK